MLIGTKKSGEDEVFYCGRADNAVKREKEHKRDCADPLNAKPAYEWARQSYNGNFRLEVIANEDASNTEDFWVTSLIKDGHPLQNAVRGNSMVPKKRSTSPIAKAFREVNANAERQERRVSFAQVLTRPQVLAQRIREDIPTAGELHQLVWIDQPTEHIKGAKQVEYLKFGDFSIYIGWKGPYKCAVRCFNRHKRTELGFTYEASLTKADRLRVLSKLVEMWADKCSWQPTSRPA